MRMSNHEESLAYLAGFTVIAISQHTKGKIHFQTIIPQGFSRLVCCQWKPSSRVLAVVRRKLRRKYVVEVAKVFKGQVFSGDGCSLSFCLCVYQT